MTQAMPSRMRQVVDWSAAVWAGAISGVAYLLLAALLGVNARLLVRMTAAFWLGADAILAENMTAVLWIVGLTTHIALAIGFACLLAIIIHRWGLLVGVIGGALFGLALYWINFFTIFEFFPWFGGLRSTPMAIVHVLFGALAGGLYEALEIEEFVEVD